MMMNNQYDSLVDALQAMEGQGPLLRFELKPPLLYVPGSDTSYQPEDLEIIEFHRFEGDTDLEDMAILYLIGTPEGQRGVLINAYGIYGNTELGNFIKRVPMRARLNKSGL